MKIKQYGMNELRQARALQQEALRLHLPPSPVVSWEAKVFAINGKKLVHIQSKSNSFTRNALNCLAHSFGACSADVISTSAVGDGIVNVKITDGTIRASTYLLSYPISSTVLELGSTTENESLNDYVLVSSGLTSASSTTRATTFNSETRKLTTLISRNFVNNTASEITVTEAGIRVATGAGNTDSTLILIIHDVFAGITVPAGGTIQWIYATEVAFPNP